MNFSKKTSDTTPDMMVEVQILFQIFQVCLVSSNHEGII